MLLIRHLRATAEILRISTRLGGTQTCLCSTQSKDTKNNQKPEDGKSLILRTNLFESAAKKDKQTYIEMVKIFEKRSVHRRNHVEFIYAALRHMEEFGVSKDIAVYKALIDVMPKGKFIPTNIFQAEFMHYPRQQQCIIDLLEQMEDNGVMPDYEMEAMLVNVFGKKGHPVRKYWRMMYWMPKFKNLSPWLLPNPVPDDALELARLAVERMCSIDPRSQIDVFDTKTVENALDHTWVVSGQSLEQSELLEAHDKQEPVYIEGPFVIWLRNRSINYYVLKSAPKKLQPLEASGDPDDVSKLENPYIGLDLRFRKTKQSGSAVSTRRRSVHEQEDGIIYAICCTGSSTKDSLLSWIRLLEKEKGNAALASLAVLFKFTSPSAELLVPEEDSNKVQH
ncbi:evolutionarily conserved signaling intermediate in Toll pathway, mitochondrial [Anopheles ziemanni]|uniref:evolutionarily conserved signaling intermediate in Toll pathway, mitochondrial n=1 Tax=Anopheles coustani TaxID=139045 RepID=UPI00265AF78B|nr:evolutionarily conserved signaling intermediate in Toll pathway, mitochondrial [Anopheles coustani]XP_058167952.1 evolutionarily conserved signaling intermediate in Toll pathway, mitochondrial [Anopheles ziemanni]